MDLVNLLDEDLLCWNKFRNGSADAFGELMRTHYQDLFSYGIRFTKDERLVKDCIQDLFLSLWMHRMSINDTEFVKYYLLKSLRHNLTKSLRHNLTRRISKPRRRGEPAFEYDPSRKIHKVITGLSRRQQEIIYLRFHWNAETADIADIMVLSESYVVNLLQDALRRLAKIPSKNAKRRIHDSRRLGLFP
jgi:RNA polymerase sigma factor (sigma-70 family)